MKVSVTLMMLLIGIAAGIITHRLVCGREVCFAAIWQSLDGSLPSQSGEAKR